MGADPGSPQGVDEYEARGTPAAVLIAPDARIASRVAGGADAIRSSWRTPRRRPSADGAAEGAQADGCGHRSRSRSSTCSAPSAATSSGCTASPDLNSRTVDLADIRGRPVAAPLLEPQLRLLRPDARRPARVGALGPDRRTGVRRHLAPECAQQNRNPGPRSTILLDEGFATAQAFGQPVRRWPCSSIRTATSPRASPPGGEAVRWTSSPQPDGGGGHRVSHWLEHPEPVHAEASRATKRRH